MNKNVLQIALCPDADYRWIAGVLYAQNITRALSSLPDTERPDTHLFIGRKFDGDHYASLRQSVSSTQLFDYDTSIPLSKHFKYWRRALFKKRPWPRSLAHCLRRSKADLILPCRHSLGPHFKSPWIGWIPDFQHIHLPEFFSAEEILRRDQQFQELIDDATHMVVSSQDAYRDLICYYNACPENISVYSYHTHTDPSWFEGTPAQTVKKYDLPAKFLMFPSQFWQHKNHLTLLSAIAKLKERGHADIFLVLTGKDTDYRNPEHPEKLKRFITQHGLEANVRHLGLLPRQDQMQLMRHASAIVQPSHFEGWSMLVEDCRALGKIMFLSDLAVHKEQAYSGAHYFDRHSSDDLANILAEQWPLLQSGPDIEAEAQAKQETEALIAKSGRVLMEIFEKTLAHHAKGL